MPFQAKVQPLDCQGTETEFAKPMVKSRLKRLFERQFQSVLRISTSEKLGGFTEVEPSSLCLDEMVIGFIEEESNFDKLPQRGCCNCFNGNRGDENSDDDEFGNVSRLSVSPSGDSVVDAIKSLVLCNGVMESKLLSDALKISEKAKNCKDKDDRLRVIAAGLCALGYNSSLCKSKWERTASIPAGEHSYIDMIAENSRLILDVDFKSEFEIARSTKSYRAVLQQLPSVFVGTEERLQQIVTVVSEAARQSLKKKGLHVPPWRKCEYMKAKWLSSHQRTTAMDADAALEESVSVEGETADGVKGSSDVLNFTVSIAAFSGNIEKLEGNCKGSDDMVCSFKDEKSEVKTSLLATPLLARPKSGVKLVTGLASVL